MSPHFCAGFAPELWFICTVAAPRIPALILASSGLCKAVATEFLQRAPVLPPSYDVAIETNMALRPPRGHFTDPVRQWRSAFTQRFLKAAVTWWKRRSWRSLLVIGSCFVCSTGQKDSSGSSVGWDLRAFTRAVARGETASWFKKNGQRRLRCAGSHVECRCQSGQNERKWTDLERPAVSSAAFLWESILGVLRKGFQFVMAHNRKCFWHLRGLSTLRCRQVKRSAKNWFSMLICFPLLQWRRADQKK